MTSQSVALCRVLCDELSRVLNHLLTMSAICLDLGAMGPIFWAFEEREVIMEFFERVSGARMHTALYRPFSDIGALRSSQVEQAICATIQRGSRVISGAFVGLLSNRALRSRCAHIGAFSQAKAKSYGVTGVIARACGVAVDARVGLGASQYSAYGVLRVSTYLGGRGDVYDRLVLRIREMLESYSILTQLMSRFATAGYTSAGVRSGSKSLSMESVIAHFKNAAGYTPTSRGSSLSCVEGPKGLVGVLVISDGGLSPYRVQVRSPVAHNLNLLSTHAARHTFADFVATFCSMDVVLGEIDR